MCVSIWDQDKDSQIVSSQKKGQKQGLGLPNYQSLERDPKRDQDPRNYLEFLETK